MAKKNIEMEMGTYDTIFEIANREKFPKCLEILKRYVNGKIALDQEDAEYLADVLSFESTRLCLKNPYTDEHPDYDEDVGEEWADYCQSAYLHAMRDLGEDFDLESLT